MGRMPPNGIHLMTITDTDTRHAQRMAALYGTPLTWREHQILPYLARGLSNTEIGDAIFVSEDTVKTHLRHAMARLGACNRTDLAVMAIAHGLVEVALLVHEVDGRPVARVVVTAGREQIEPLIAEGKP